MPDNLLPKFFELLQEAQEASQATDFFDLHSEVPESAAKWQELLADQRSACKSLVLYCAMMGPELFWQLETIGP